MKYFKQLFRNLKILKQIYRLFKNDAKVALRNLINIFNDIQSRLSFYRNVWKDDLIEITSLHIYETRNGNTRRNDSRAYMPGTNLCTGASWV